MASTDKPAAVRPATPEVPPQKCPKCGGDLATNPHYGFACTIAPAPAVPDAAARLEEQEFYELMQQYRHAPIEDQAKTIMAFGAVKLFIRALIREAQGEMRAPEQRPEHRIGHATNCLYSQAFGTACTCGAAPAPTKQENSKEVMPSEQ